MRKILLAVLAVALVLLGAGAATAAGYLYAPSPDNPIVTSGCVIRFDERTSSGNTRPTIHANSTHYCVGVKSISVDYRRGSLVVNMNTVGPIVGIVSQPDETLTARDIQCGPRGGMGTISVYCYRNGKQIKMHSSAMYGAGANLWLSWTSWDQ